MLAPLVQRQLRIWIENGLPPGTVRAERVRWIATAREEDPWSDGGELDATLEDALAGIVIRIPPLRDRMEALDAMVASAAASAATSSFRRLVGRRKSTEDESTGDRGNGGGA